MLKRIATSLILLPAIYCASAQETNTTPVEQSSTTVVADTTQDELISRNIFVELGGPSIGFGIGYDQRFKPASIFGFRAGLSFTNGSSDNTTWSVTYDNCKGTWVDFKGVTFPLEVNAIMGKRASKFELGAGFTPCILHRHDIRYHGGLYGHSTDEITDGTRLNIFGTINIGYRLQRKSGFFLRAGMTLTLGDLNCSPFDGLVPLSYISLGYTIR